MASLHPSHGARIVLSRIEAHEGAHYSVEVYAPEGARHEAQARLDGGFTLTWATNAPAPWVVTYVERILLGLAKKHAKDASWPRKLTRWRDERG